MLSYGTVDGQYSLFLMNADGSDRHRIAESDLDMVFGRWSPDGSRIAFFRMDRETLLAGLSLIDPDGTNEVEVTPLDGRDEDPSWSPDGRELVFHAFNRDQNWNIYIVTSNRARFVRSSTSRLKSTGQSGPHDFTYLGASVRFERRATVNEDPG